MLRALGLCVLFTASPASSSLGRWEVPLEKQTLSLKPAPGLAHTPGRSGTGQSRAPRESAEGTHLPQKRAGGGGRGQKRACLPSPTPAQPKPHQAPVIDQSPRPRAGGGASLTHPQPSGQVGLRAVTSCWVELLRPPSLWLTGAQPTGE